jgi:hypothetical protein
VVKNNKLGCRAFKAVGALGPGRKTQGMNISQLWASASISATGEDKSDQMLSLRKKIFKHKVQFISQIFQYWKQQKLNLLKLYAPKLSKMKRK